MNRIYFLFSLLTLAILFSQCQKEISYSLGNDTQNTNPDPVTSVLQGNVVDENGNPAIGVTVKVGAKTATTNARGYFRIPAAPLDKNVSLVTAEKAGYFKSYRTFSATSGANQVVIKLIKKTQAGTINASSGGELTLVNGSKIALPANGVVKAQGGAAYTGAVRVFASYIDPTASDIAQTVPGSFMANDKDNNRVALESYGMMAVELEGSAGEKLQIGQGSAATLTSPIPASLQASAPATISLWFMDEQTGIWKEEGKATKNGNSYVGEVKHFSFWNCDVGVAAVTLSLTLKTNEGVPLVHTLVRIKRTNPLSQTYGYTDSLGQVSGLVPQNESFVLDVLDNCNNSIFNQNIGPFTQNTNLGVITLSSTTNGLVTLKGKLLNCSGAPVSNGYSIINFDNFSYYATTDAGGNFSRTFTHCSSLPASIQVLGIDAAAQQQGSVINVPVVSPLTNAGSLSACGSSTLQFINYTMDDTLHTISSIVGDTIQSIPDSSQGTTGSQFRGYHGASNDFISFEFNATGTGTFPLQYLSVDHLWNNTLVQPFNVVITKYPLTFGDYWEGSFSGNFVDPFSVSHTISASFRIRKQ